MRASELIGSPVVDESGCSIGVVRDLRVAVGGDGVVEGFPVVGVVIGEPGLRSAAAHAWGYAQGRAAAPWPLRRWLEPAVADSLFVPAERVIEWGPDPLRLRGGAEDLRG